MQDLRIRRTHHIHLDLIIYKYVISAIAVIETRLSLTFSQDVPLY